MFKKLTLCTALYSWWFLFKPFAILGIRPLHSWCVSRSIGTAPGTIYSTPILGKYRTKIVQQMWLFSGNLEHFLPILTQTCNKREVEMLIQGIWESFCHIICFHFKSSSFNKTEYNYFLMPSEKPHKCSICVLYFTNIVHWICIEQGVSYIWVFPHIVHPYHH